MDYIDNITGHRVERLTDPGTLSHHMYFYNRMTTPDGRLLLIARDHGGERRLHLLDLEDGDSREITSGPGLDDYGAMIAEDGKSAFYAQGRHIFRQELDGTGRESVYETPEGWDTGNWGMGEGNRYLVLAHTRLDTLPRRKEGNWDFFAETCLAHPLSRLVLKDLHTGRTSIVREERCWLTHPQLRPGDPSTILYSHEGPYNLIDARLWLIRSDGTGCRCCREQPEDLILTHEFWLPDGSRFAFVYQETTGERREELRLFDPGTMREETLMEVQPYAHMISDSTGRLFAGDAQSGNVPIHLLGPGGANGHGNDFIYLIDTEKRTEERLCYHGTSWSAMHGNPQDSHPHPCFTPDGKSVIFTSDREGKPAVYRAYI